MPPRLTEAAFRRAVAELTARDPRLAAALRRYGHPPFWRRPPGFPALVLLILEQQVSIASARAAFDRLSGHGPVTPHVVARLDDADLRRAGFSRQKARYVRSLADALVVGDLDLDSLSRRPDEEVREALTALPGIGPWTADVYLLTCLGRPDVWPIGDRALQVAAAEVLGLPAPPGPGGLEELGERWRPHRATAAQILWHAYLAARGR